MSSLIKNGLSSGEGRLLAEEFGLLSWYEVQAQWNEMSGESISRQRVRQIALKAEQKLREELAGFFELTQRMGL